MSTRILVTVAKACATMEKNLEKRSNYGTQNFHTGHSPLPVDDIVGLPAHDHCDPASGDYTHHCFRREFQRSHRSAFRVNHRAHDSTIHCTVPRPHSRCHCGAHLRTNGSSYHRSDYSADCPAYCGTDYSAHYPTCYGTDYRAYCRTYCRTYYRTHHSGNHGTETNTAPGL